jgi:predicted molibdopterin-dependent oxidoreductase YjgC
MGEAVQHKAVCRICINGCALNVQVKDGVVVDVLGDRENPLFQGYICVKGRAQPAFLNSPTESCAP